MIPESSMFEQVHGHGVMSFQQVDADHSLLTVGATHPDGEGLSVEQALEMADVLEAAAKAVRQQVLELLEADES